MSVLLTLLQLHKDITNDFPGRGTGSFVEMSVCNGLDRGMEEKFESTSGGSETKMGVLFTGKTSQTTDTV